jgi:hypothetical protein
MSVSYDACDTPSDPLDAADLTVLVRLVRQAKEIAERRPERRQHLGQVSPRGDPGRTKTDKREGLLAKLEELQSQVQ